MATFACQYEQHGGAEVQAICLADCIQRQWVCVYCMKEQHQSHLDKCLTFKQIISEIENISKKIALQLEEKQKSFADIIQRYKIVIKQIESNLMILKEWIQLMNNQFYQDPKIEKMIKFLKRNQKEEQKKNAKSFFQKGMTMRQQQQHEAALIQFEKALQMDPNCVDAFYGKGETVLYIQGSCLRYFQKYDEAIVLLEKVVQINPKYWQAHFEKGACLQMLNRFEEAVNCYNKALVINPNNEVISAQKNYCFQQYKQK